MTEPTPIEYPWIIVMGKEKVTTILAGPPHANETHFGIAIADIVRHVAKRFDVDEADVMRVVNHEIDDPTSEITGGRPS